MRYNQLFTFIGALSAALGVNAATVLLTTNDASGSSSFNAAGHWSIAQAPGSANDYFTAGFQLRTPASGSSNYFAGNSLSLDSSSSSATVGLLIKYPAAGSVRVDNLKLNGGAIFNGVGSTMSVYGHITVLTNSFLDPQASGRTLAIYAPISGGSTNTIGLRAVSGSAGGIVQLLGDNSGYNGNWYVWGLGDGAPGAVLQVGNGGTNGSLGAGWVINDDSLVFNRADMVTVNNFISGPGSVVQAGPGTLKLAAANNYTGSTTLSSGTLALGASGSVAGSSLISLAGGTILDVSAAAGFSLASGQTLTGSGTVFGALAAGAGATVAPGDATGGTLTVNGDVTLGNCSLGFNLNAPNGTGGTNSLLLVNGNLTLNPAIALNAIFPNGVPMAGTYTLCQCTGVLAGSPDDFITSLGTNVVSLSLNTAASPKSVTMTVSGSIPSPASNSALIIKVYLEAGQSNADGRAVTNGLPGYLLLPQPSVPFYYYLTGGAANGDGTLGTFTTLRPGCSAIGGGTTFGPELTFGRTLANYYAISNGVATNQVMVALIKYAHGGTSLVSNWAATGAVSTNGDGPDYLIFQQVVKAGLARLAATYPTASLELDGLIWVQGETDIDNGVAASTAYGTNLIRFINDVRLKFSTNQPYGQNLPFFFSRLSAQQTYYSLPADASYSNYLLVRAGQNYAAATLLHSNVFLLDIDGSQFTTLTPYASPGLHFDTAGQQALGTAFAQAVRAALPLSRLQVPAKSAAGWSIAFSGVTGTAHALQRAPAPTGPWTLLTNMVMNPFGSASYDDLVPLAPAAFYRVSRP